MIRRTHLLASGLALALIFAVSGCIQGLPSDKPAIHINPNMDDQPKYEAQEANEFFADGLPMRIPVEGTIARGQLARALGGPLETGLDANGDTLLTMPMPVTRELLLRGQERYGIYCTPCHGQTGGAGDLKGIVVQRGMTIIPPSYHDPRLVAAPDGYLYDVITNGVRNMWGYKWQIPVEDRWAIVAYMRVLQRSQAGTLEDVPPTLRDDL